MERLIFGVPPAVCTPGRVSRKALYQEVFCFALGTWVKPGMAAPGKRWPIAGLAGPDATVPCHMAQAPLLCFRSTDDSYLRDVIFISLNNVRFLRTFHR